MKQYLIRVRYRDKTFDIIVHELTAYSIFLAIREKVSYIKRGDEYSYEILEERVINID